MLKNHKVFSFSDGDKDISYGPFSLSENDGQSQTDGLALPVSQLVPSLGTFVLTPCSNMTPGENLFLFNTNFSNKFLLILVGAIVGVELSSFLCLTLGLLRLFLPVTMSLRIDQWTTACQGWAIWIVRYWQMLQKIWLCEWLRGKEVLRPYIMVVSYQRFVLTLPILILVPKNVRKKMLPTGIP
ncbi:hypothetical protein L204_100965 [Cryptococcus depauperatus]